MQRFGTAPIPTHAVGLALLRSDWALASHLLLVERDGEGDDAKLARILWKEGKFEDAVRTMPRRCVAERASELFFFSTALSPLLYECEAYGVYEAY